MFLEINNSLRSLLTPNSAKLVHTPSHQSQDLIANVFGNKVGLLPPPSNSREKIIQKRTEKFL